MLKIIFCILSNKFVTTIETICVSVVSEQFQKNKIIKVQQHIHCNNNKYKEEFSTYLPFTNNNIINI